jgi:uncharacterized membrane protein YphA (DoxX/SURF4 family)
LLDVRQHPRLVEQRFLGPVEAEEDLEFSFNHWWVPTVEFTGGAGVTIGFLAPLTALGLLVIILVAIATSGRQRIKAYKPIDEADRFDDWLYLPETLYAFMLIVVISAGAGPYSVDAIVLGLIRKPDA